MDKELPSDAIDSSFVQAAPVLLAEDCSPTFRQRSHSLPSATALFSDGQHSAGIVDGIGTSWNHMVARWLRCYHLITTVCERAAAASRLVLRSRTAAMHLWRSSVDVVLRSARKFYSREILWSAVVADDPDQAFASLCDQGMLIEEIQIPVKAGDVASDSCPNSISWPRQAESISRSLPGPPVRIVIISDTHSQHARMTTPLPAGDILVHCGDMTDTGKATEMSSFLQWFASHPHPHKVMIAGNHDVTLDEHYYASSWQRFHTERCNNLIHEETSDGFVPPPTSARALFYGNNSGIIALENSGVCIRGLQFWGSPFSAEFCKWSHSVERGQPAADLWKQIPAGTHVLLTHGPPVGHGDLVNQRRTGDVRTRVKPLLHLFGHIHEGYGWSTDGYTLYGNAATCTENYKPTNSPLVVDLNCSLIHQ